MCTCIGTCMHICSVHACMRAAYVFLTEAGAISAERQLFPTLWLYACMHVFLTEAGAISAERDNYSYTTVALCMHVCVSD